MDKVCRRGLQIKKFQYIIFALNRPLLNPILGTFYLLQHFDQKTHRGATDPYLGGYYVMCGATVGCVICEGYAFFIKKCMST